MRAHVCALFIAAALPLHAQTSVDYAVTFFDSIPLRAPTHSRVTYRIGVGSEQLRELLPPPGGLEIDVPGEDIRIYLPNTSELSNAVRVQ